MSEPTRRELSAVSTMVRALVEGVLTSDDAIREAGDGVQDAKKAYQKSKQPGFIEGFSLLLDLTSLFRAGIGILKVTSSGAGAAAVLEVAGKGHTLAKTGKDAETKDAAARGGDATTAMTDALNKKVDAVDSGVEVLRGYAFGKEKAEIGMALNGCITTIRILQGGLEALRAPTPALLTRAGEVHENLAAFDRSMRERLHGLERLVRARDHAQGGGGELGKGSTGRTVFDIISQNPGGCTLLVETQLSVESTWYEKRDSAIEPKGYWLRIKDASLADQLTYSLFPFSVNPAKPTFVEAGDRHLPDHIGRPLTTLVETQEMPYEVVHLEGVVAKEWATRAEYDNPGTRANLFPRLPSGPRLR